MSPVTLATTNSYKDWQKNWFSLNNSPEKSKD